MKLIIVRAGIKGTDGFLIETEPGWGKFQRKNLYSAMDNPLSPDEELICMLCERILELENGKTPKKENTERQEERRETIKSRA